jgi:hypothetical protein
MTIEESNRQLINSLMIAHPISDNGSKESIHYDHLKKVLSFRISPQTKEVMRKLQVIITRKTCKTVIA